MGAGNELGGAGAATGELEEGYFVRRSRATFHRLTLIQLRQPAGQPQLAALAIEQYQLGAYA
ncbi:hypothetical protein D3C85_1901190 [compost metagenome]